MHCVHGRMSECCCVLLQHSKDKQSQCFVRCMSAFEHISFHSSRLPAHALAKFAKWLQINLTYQVDRAHLGANTAFNNALMATKPQCIAV